MSVTKLTCIVCPQGCSLEVDSATGTVVGNSCKRGAAYGIAETTNPTRTLTSTVCVVDDSDVRIDMEPVRTAEPIPKSLLFAAMKEIDALRVKKPIRRGDAVIVNLLGTGVDVIATRDLL